MWWLWVLVLVLVLQRAHAHVHAHKDAHTRAPKQQPISFLQVFFAKQCWTHDRRFTVQEVGRGPWPSHSE